MLRVKCTCGHLKPFIYLVNYSQHCPVLLQPSKGKGNFSKHMLHPYLISAAVPKHCKIVDDTGWWLSIFDEAHSLTAWRLMIRAQYMCTKKNLCILYIHHRVLVETWFRGNMCILHVTYNMYLTSSALYRSSLVCGLRIELRYWILCSRETQEYLENLLNNSSVTHL